VKVKYQIFVSSTYEDLRDQREQLIKCILEMGHIPVGMEMFSAANEEQWKVIQRQIDDCDYYVLIVAHRYGSVDKDISFTEKEYEYAIELGIPVLAFLIDETAKWSAKFIDTDDFKRPKLLAFKEKVKTKLVSFWKNSDDLYGKAAISLGKAFAAYERPGYVRSDEIANKDVFTELTRLSTENSTLRKDLETQIHERNIQKHKDEEDLVSVLRSTTRSIPIRFNGEKEWNRESSLTLLQIFECIGERSLIESDELVIKQALAVFASGRVDYDSSNPVPLNRFAEWLSDLTALELIEPSKKQHTPSDNLRYWSMTDKGKALFVNLRRIKLLQGIPTSDDPALDAEEDVQF